MSQDRVPIVPDVKFSHQAIVAMQRMFDHACQCEDDLISGQYDHSDQVRLVVARECLIDGMGRISRGYQDGKPLADPLGEAFRQQDANHKLWRVSGHVSGCLCPLCC